MKNPEAYFTDAVEQQLAGEAWKVGSNPTVDPFFTWYPPHQILAGAVETPFQKRVITARNWITAMRDQDGPWGDSGIERVKSYFKQQYKRDIAVNNLHIANVEHFYTSALIVVISGAFYALPSVGIVAYEVLLQPIAVALANFSLRAGWNNLVNGWRQLTGPDRQGVVFVLMNSNFSSLDIQQFLSVEPEIVEPGASLPPRNKPGPSQPAGKTRTVRPGESLSMIAGELYKSVELWPLLWDQNKAQIANPNRITPGMVLNYKELSTFTPAQIADAKKRSPTWKNYPH